MNSTQIISASSVDISYLLTSGSTLTAIKDFTWQLEPGLFTSIIGPSGCGKSTLLKAFAGLQPITNGQLNINLPNLETLSNISMTFQAATLLPWLNVEKNVLLPFTIAGKCIEPCVSDKLSELLEMVGLTKFRHAYPHELSGGMCMRVALVRAFITEAKLILMDEPFAALDELTRDRLCVELEKLWLTTQSTIVFITHNLSEAIYLSDRVVVLSDHPGRIIKQVDISITRPRNYDVRLSVEFSELLTTLRSVLSNGDYRSPQ